MQTAALAAQALQPVGHAVQVIDPAVPVRPKAPVVTHTPQFAPPVAEQVPVVQLVAAAPAQVTAV